ncbi:threonine dehydrogenase-like Zn-dependent dehydrogenase [Kineosphaera limosa]|uniref:Putative zinc-containing alcohol dehydrogenase n=1 Tax=Kineosphaera limosa NBRC 100340 TaxID=1184609 RepID=K6X6R6_9MICO|nr:zinc-binding dehydrogenase [Kineosphaera limosa]NYE03177.1 threonine dehydrogenase-like Zn-dependent dehydrogenase [Kineosphaera limosa]GAB94514.1 putative zinc-containing alcohol dehydrogenase [Kineosphaera limosa NBRC 100340]
MTDTLPESMAGVRLPGNSTVEPVTVPVPVPGARQVLLKTKASSICGSDIRAIYREHLGHGAEAYQGVIAGHEPCGQVVAVGAGVRRMSVGDRVVVYHIAGCGVCEECRRGYEVGCHEPFRAAHGWQRDGGHADYILVEEDSCILLPEPLTYVDGALVSCGFGTAYEGLLKAGVGGRDRLLVTGLGPVGLATAMLGRALGATFVVGSDINEGRRQQALDLGLVDVAVAPEDLDAAVAEATDGLGCEVAIDCSGNASARHGALRNTRAWGRCAFVGEGGDVSFAVSDLLIHKQITLYGSWVTSVRNMEDLLEQLVRWQLHPEVVVTHRMPLSEASRAYEIADSGEGGKVCIVFDEDGE